MYAHLSKEQYPLLTPMPVGARYALVFDVETTGLLPKADSITKSEPSIDAYPHIIQFSWVVYDLATNMIDAVENHYIRLPSHIAVSTLITDITGITQSMVDAGESIVDTLALFYKTFVVSDYVIAHNIQFDATVIYMELKRNREAVEAVLQRKIELDIFNRKFKPNMYCTMVASKDICNIMAEWKPRAPATPSVSVLSPLPDVIPNILDMSNQDLDVSSATVELIVIPDPPSVFNITPTVLNVTPSSKLHMERPLTPTRSEYEPIISANNSPKTTAKTFPKPTYKSSGYSSTPKTYKKFPKLSELHQHLFGYIPENLHNSLIDVLVCLRCFLKLRCSYSMSNRKFDILLKKHQKM